MLLFIFKCMLVCSLTGSVLIVLLRLFRPLTERFFSSSWHYFVGLCVMLIMLCPVRIKLPVNKTAAVSVPHLNEEKNTDTNTENAFYDDTAYGELTQVEEKNRFSFEMLMTFSAYAWVGVASFLIISNEVSYFLFLHNMKRKTREVERDIFISDKKLRIRCGEEISSPMVAGIISPVLYIPDTPLTDEELRMIVSHEAVHLRRKDLLAKKMICFVKCIHFFNPLVYFMSKKIDLDCEISCDLAATRKMDDEQQKSYMLTILELISKSRKSRPAFAAGIVSGKEALKRRFSKIKKGERISKKTKIISVMIASAALISTLCISGVYAAGIKTPQNDRQGTESEISTAQTSVAQSSDNSHSDRNDTPYNDSHDTDKCDVSFEIVCYPCDEKQITCDFDHHNGHNGVDFAADKGSPVYACTDGKVIFAGVDEKNPGDGIKVIVQTDDATKFVCAHLESVCVKNGESVYAGQVIASSGSTGKSTGPHLHFSVIKDGKYVDPQLYLR